MTIGTDKSNVKTNPGADALKVGLGEVFDSLGEDTIVVDDKDDDLKDDQIKDNNVVDDNSVDDSPDGDKTDDEKGAVIDDPEKDDVVVDDDTGDDLDSIINPVQDDTHDNKSDDDNEAIKEFLDDPHGNPKTKKRIRRLLGKNQTLKKEAKDLAARITELESAVEVARQEVKSDPLTDEERREMNMLRRRYEVDQDPEIREKFDSKIQSHEDNINKIVDKTLEPDQAAAIKKMGFEAFARSNPDLYKEFMKQLGEDSPLDVNIVNASVGEIQALRMQRDRDVAKMTEGADEYFANKAKEAEQLTETRKAQMAQLREQTYDTLIVKDKYFSEIDTKGLEGEELSRATAENKRRERYRAQAHKMLNTATVENQQEMLYRATHASRLADMLKDQSAQLKKVTEELAKIKGKQSLKKGKAAPKKADKAVAPKEFGEQLDEAAARPIKTIGRVIPN